MRFQQSLRFQILHGLYRSKFMRLPQLCSLLLKRCDLICLYLYQSCILTHQFLVQKDGRNTGGRPLKSSESLIQAFFFSACHQNAFFCSSKMSRKGFVCKIKTQTPYFCITPKYLPSVWQELQKLKSEANKQPL